MSFDTTKVFNKNAFDNAVSNAVNERTNIFKKLYPRPSTYDKGNYPKLFEFQRLAGHKDYTFSKLLLEQLNKKISDNTTYDALDLRSDRDMFNFIDLLYKSYINSAPRPQHVHKLSLKEKDTLDPNKINLKNNQCDICDTKRGSKITRNNKTSFYMELYNGQSSLHTFYTCDICNYDECLRCHRRSDREKHEHDLSILHSTGRGESTKYSCNTCGRFTESGKCWICKTCEKEGKTYVECYVCHSEPTKDEAVLPNILDGINIIVKNNNKTESLIVRPAPAPATLNNTPAGGKRHHTKRKRHHKDNRTRRNRN
jgi:hypothetical protein